MGSDVAVAAEDVAFAGMAGVEAAVGACRDRHEPVELLHVGAIAGIPVGDNLGGALELVVVQHVCIRPGLLLVGIIGYGVVGLVGHAVGLVEVHEGERRPGGAGIGRELDLLMASVVMSLGCASA